MAGAFTTFASFASRMMIAKTICLDIQLVSLSCIFETKMIFTMFITKFLVTVAAVVGAAAGPTENTGANID